MEEDRLTSQDETLQTCEEPPLVHDFLDWKFRDRVEAALNWVNTLSVEDALAYHTDDLTRVVERFAIPRLIVHTDKPKRDEKMPELEDLTIDRKTGATGHIFLVPIEGEAEWLQEIEMQTVLTDGHPIAFLDKERSWIYIKLRVSPDDPEGTLKRELDERLVLIAQYSAYVSDRITEFNRALAVTMTEDLNKRKKAIQKGRMEAEATGLATAYNPKHAERAIQIERLMENLNARFKTAGDQPLSNEIGNQRITNQMSDLHQDALTIAKCMYENKFYRESQHNCSRVAR